MKTTETRIQKRRAEDRGQSDHGCLQARFTFSFADYFDPDHMGFHALRVMNNDTIQAGGGFPTHPHRSMEIFTYVIDGQLEHTDSMGNGAIIEAGNLQYMSAGKGVLHSEFNPSSEHATHLYQVWITPKVEGGTPRYAEVPLGKQAEANRMHLLFSGDGRDGSTEIRQDAEIFYARVEAGEQVSIPASESMPHAWVQVLDGALTVLNVSAARADGLAISDAPQGVELVAQADTEVLVFRLG